MASSLPRGASIDQLFGRPAHADRLPGPVQAQMGAAFGLDLSAVDVYRDSTTAVDAGAEAFASSGAIHFAPGAYDPTSTHGLELIGHEVAHLAQQTEGRATQAQAKGTGESPELEAEADALGARAARGEVGLLGGGASRAPAHVAVMQRKPTKWLDIKPKGLGMNWMPHRTTIDSAGHSEATGAMLDVSPATIVYGPTGKAGGTSVDARNVGRQQRPGTTIAPIPKAAHDLAAASAAAGRSLRPPSPYEVVAMFPVRHGGVSDERNALVVPPAVAGALRNLQAVVDSLVDAGSFVDYRVGVTEQVEDNVAYAASLTVTWDQVDPSGKPVPGTRGQSTITVSSPRVYGAGNVGTQSLPPTIDTHPNQALPGTHHQRHPDARTAELRTRIDFGAVTTDKDATRMTAHVLGPDHQIGAQPKAGQVWGERTAELAEASENKMVYVAGHLLNHHLGGPGNDERNLAPIPDDVNGLHESLVESVIKRLVNIQNRWVYYDVQVSYSSDTYLAQVPAAPATVPTGAGTGRGRGRGRGRGKANTQSKAPAKAKGPTASVPMVSAPKTVNYPSQFTCTWWQLDPAGKPIPDTVGYRELPIRRPTDYGKAPIETDKVLPKLAVEGKKSLGLEAEHAVADGAKTSLGFDEVLLEDDNTLKGQVAVMQPLVGSLTALGLNMYFETNGALKDTIGGALAAVKPSPTEVTARDAIDQMSAHLHATQRGGALDNAAPLIVELRTRLEAFAREVKARGARATDAAKRVADFHLAVPNAVKFAEQLEAVRLQAARDLDTVTQGALAAIAIAERAIREQHATRAEFHSSASFVAQRITGESPSQDLTPSQLAMQTKQVFESYVEEQRVPPMSPNQLDDFWQQENELDVEHRQPEPTTSRGKQAQLQEHRRVPVHKKNDVYKRRRLFTGEPAPREHGAERLLALVERAPRWPSCDNEHELAGDALVVGRAIEAVIPLWSTARASVEVTVKALYESKPKAILRYLQWATKWIDDHRLETPAEQVESPLNDDEVELDIDLNLEPPQNLGLLDSSTVDDDSGIPFPVSNEVDGFHSPRMQSVDGLHNPQWPYGMRGLPPSSPHDVSPIQHHGQGMPGGQPFHGGRALQPPSTSGVFSFLAPQNQGAPPPIQQYDVLDVGAPMVFDDDPFEPDLLSSNMDPWY